MGILDDLKSQRAEHDRRTAEQVAHARRLQMIYETDLLPRLQRLYGYLNELVDHLNTLTIETEVDFRIGTAGRISGYRQRGYEIRVDSESRMTEIRLNCRCESETPARMEVATVADRDEAREVLNRCGVRFADRARYDRRRVPSGYLFEVAPRLDATLHIRVDLNTLETRLAFFNLGALGWRDLDVRPGLIDEDFQEKLARYILREDESLFQIGLSEAERRALKEQFEREQREKRLEEVLARQYTPATDVDSPDSKPLSKLLAKLRRK
jgi:hypothetical protein